MEAPSCVYMQIGNKFLVATKTSEFKDCDQNANIKKQITLHSASNNNQRLSESNQLLPAPLSPGNSQKTAIYEPLSDLELQITRTFLVCDERRATEEHAFRVMKIEKQHRRDVLYVNSVLPFLQYFIHEIRVGNKL